MATPLAENMRAGNTARVNAFRVGGSRVGAVFTDIRPAPTSGKEYIWDMESGVRKLDTVLADTDWTSDQR